MTGTKIHEVWKEMNRRCKDNNNRSISYKKRGISVCQEWTIAKNFIDWALSNGYKEGLQIDREDNNGGYSPENCRWVTPQVNANNRINTIYLTFENKTLSLYQWSKITGIKHHTIYTRLGRGWPIEKILTKLVQQKGI